MQKKPDPSIFYSLAYINKQREAVIKDPEWGSFITPRASSHLTLNEHDKLLNSIPPLRNVSFNKFKKTHPILDTLMEAIYADETLTHSHRCSAKYYVDIVLLLIKIAGNTQRIVEVGPYLGDLSYFFAGISHKMNIPLDLVDTNKFNLCYAYEQIVRVFPEAATKIRLFLGDLPIYTQKHLLPSSESHFIHYEASHNFNDVIRDLGATFFVRNKIIGTAIHNTHLRTTRMNHYAFTDVALHTLFGANIAFAKLGEEVNEETNLMKESYFANNRVDGLYLDYSKNTFRFPHPNTPLEFFLYQAEEQANHTS